MVLWFVLARLCFIRGSRMAVTAMPRTRMTQAESQTRLDLAACYRLVDLFGWSDLINTPHHRARPGPAGPFPDQPLRHAVRRDHRLIAG
jgi:hypothetical protein